MESQLLFVDNLLHNNTYILFKPRIHVKISFVLKHEYEAKDVQSTVGQI